MNPPTTSLCLICPWCDTPQLLTACERAFGDYIPHAAVNDITSVEDAVHYWEERHEAQAEARRRAQEHWSVAHPANVTVLRGQRHAVDVALQDWLADHAKDARAGDADQDGVPF